MFRALQLGDLLCAVPAWRALRAAYPEAAISLIGLPWARDFVRRFHTYLDDFIPFPGYPGLPEQEPDLNRLPEFLSEMQRRQIDLFLQMHGSGSYVNDLAPLCNARESAGFYTPPHDDCHAHDRFMRYPDDLPEIHRHLRLMEFLGIPSLGDELEFPLTEEDQAAFAELQQDIVFSPDNFVCIHPGGRGMNRRWPVERFAGVAHLLMARSCRIVLTGTAGEEELADRLADALSEPPVNLVGKTTLGTLGVLLSHARLLVANDTGVSHMAAALRTPSVIISVGSDPVRWGPLNRRRHRLLVGIETGVEDVIQEIDAVLDESRSPGYEPAVEPLSTDPAMSALRVSVTPRPLRILTWHVHGNYLYYLTHTPHEWFLPVGRPHPGYAGRAPGFPWADRVHDIPVEQLRRTEFDCILFQSRPHYCEDQYGLFSNSQRRLPRIYLEHDPPQEDPTDSEHVVDDPDMLLVHVTEFNRLMWSRGRTPTCVIEHGIPPQTHRRCTGELAKGLVVINDLPRRGRRVGADVWERVRHTIPLDLIGMNSLPAGGLGEVSHEDLPAFMCRYRFFFHPIRYTSLGLAVCEAMHLGLPIVALATTEMSTVITNHVSGYVDTNVETLIQRMAYLLASPSEARRLGAGARRTAESRFSLDRFVNDWDRTLHEFTSRHSSQRRAGDRPARQAGITGNTPCIATLR